MTGKLSFLFQRFILSATAVLLAFICLCAAGSACCTLGKGFPVNLLYPVLFGSLQLLSLLGLRRLLARLDGRGLRLYTAGVFAMMTGIFVLLILSLRIAPLNDSRTLADQALFMAHTGEQTMDAQGIYADYFGKYGNNYLLCLIFRRIFRITGALGLSDAQSYLTLELLNMCAMLAGVFFLWRFACRLRGQAFGALVLTLYAAQPALYLTVFWVYSNTLSLPFLTGMLDLTLAIRLDMNDGKTAPQPGRMPHMARIRPRIYPILWGITVAAGILIRPTTAIPVLALLLCLPLHHEHRSTEFRSRCVSFAGAAKAAISRFLPAFLTAAIVFAALTRLNGACFRTVSANNYPITHWLMMGSHDNGMYSRSDDRFTFSLPSAQEKKAATRAAVLRNYRSLGPAGTVGLWAKKTAITWSDGYFAMEKRLMQPMRYSPLYTWLAGENRGVFVLYCRSSWLLVLALTLAGNLARLRRRSCPTVVFLLYLSLFGAMIFYFFWEVKAAYAIPFVPLFVLLAADACRMGSPSAVTAPERRLPSGGTAPGRPLLPGGVFPAGRSTRQKALLHSLFGLCLALCLGAVYYDHPAVQRMDSIRCEGTSWLTALRPEETDELTQTFYPNHAFNRISLLVSREPDGDGETKNCSYVLLLSDGSGAVLKQWRLNASDVAPRTQPLVTLSLETLPASTTSGYTLTIRREPDGEGGLRLMTRKGICLDTYPGVFCINGAPQGTDLYLQVYEKS